VTIQAATWTAASLLQHLSLQTAGTSASVNGDIQQQTTDALNTTPLNQSTSDVHILMLKDQLEGGGMMHAVLEIRDEQFSQIKDFLTQIRDVAVAQSNLNETDAGWDVLARQRQDLEQALSAFIGSQIHADELDLNANLAPGTVDNSFFNVVDIFNDPDTQRDLAGQVAAIEVDFQHLLSQTHDSANCPHCSGGGAATTDGAGVEIPYALNPTNTTNVTGATLSGASGSSQIEPIRMTNKWDLSSGELLTYSYYTGSVPYDPAYNANSGTPGTPSSVDSHGAGNSAVLDQAFAAWDKAAEFEFSKITESGTTVGEMRVAFTNRSSSAAAFAYGPSNSTAGGDVYFETEDIDIAGTDFASSGVGSAGYNYFAALHEIGHALGLSHPFDGGSATGATLPLAEDNQRNSVMSYVQLDRNYALDLTGGTSANSQRIYASTPMLYDIRAMEYLYGAETTSDGDNNYQFANNAQLLMTIADVDGTDTFDASLQTRSSIINLAPGTLSSVGIYTKQQQIDYWVGQGWQRQSIEGFIATLDTQASAAQGASQGTTRTALYTGEDNVAIAHNALIENAVGGTADDTITGNYLGNRITGGGGNDTIDGGTGEDIAIFQGDASQYTITTVGGVTTVADQVANRDGTDSLTNIEHIQFSTSTPVAGRAITSAVTASDLRAANLTFDIAVDGGTAVSVSVTGADYTASSLNIYASDIEAAINLALTNAGQTGRVTVAVNSPLTITSQTTGAASSVALTNLSADMAASLGTVTSEAGVNAGGAVYYNIVSGQTTTTAPAGTAGPTPTGNTTTTGGNTTTNPPPSGTGGGGGSGGSSLADISLLTAASAAEAVEILDRALSQVDSSRARLGSVINRLEYAIANLSSQSRNTEIAAGRITDADFAKETSKLVKEQILQQAAQQAMAMSYRGMQTTLKLVS